MNEYTVSINMDVQGIEAETPEQAKEELLRLLTEDEGYRKSAIVYMDVEDTIYPLTERKV